MDVAESAYRVTQRFPKEEIFGITAQIRRAASSVPLNIAEGWGRGIGAANVNSCKIARGSAYELRTALQLGKRLGYGSVVELETLLLETVRMRQLLNAYISGMEKNYVKEPLAAYANGSE